MGNWSQNIGIKNFPSLLSEWLLMTGYIIIIRKGWNDTFTNDDDDIIMTDGFEGHEGFPFIIGISQAKRTRERLRGSKSRPVEKFKVQEEEVSPKNHTGPNAKERWKNKTPVLLRNSWQNHGMCMTHTLYEIVIGWIRLEHFYLGFPCKREFEFKFKFLFDKAMLDECRITSSCVSMFVLKCRCTCFNLEKKKKIKKKKNM